MRVQAFSHRTRDRLRIEFFKSDGEHAGQGYLRADLVRLLTAGRQYACQVLRTGGIEGAVEIGFDQSCALRAHRRPRSRRRVMQRCSAAFKRSSTIEMPLGVLPKVLAISCTGNSSV